MKTTKQKAISPPKEDRLNKNLIKKCNIYMANVQRFITVHDVEIFAFVCGVMVLFIAEVLI